MQALQQFQKVLGENTFRLSRKRAQDMDCLRSRKRGSAEILLKQYLSGQECSMTEHSDGFGSIADIAYAV